MKLTLRLKVQLVQKLVEGRLPSVPAFAIFVNYILILIIT